MLLLRCGWACWHEIAGSGGFPYLSACFLVALKAQIEQRHVAAYTLQMTRMSSAFS